MGMRDNIRVKGYKCHRSLGMLPWSLHNASFVAHLLVYGTPSEWGGFTSDQLIDNQYQNISSKITVNEWNEAIKVIA
jgi:hypothetical protein